MQRVLIAQLWKSKARRLLWSDVCCTVVEAKPITMCNIVMRRTKTLGACAFYQAERSNISARRLVSPSDFSSRVPAHQSKEYSTLLPGHDDFRHDDCTAPTGPIATKSRIEHSSHPQCETTQSAPLLPALSTAHRLFLLMSCSWALDHENGDHRSMCANTVILVWDAI